MKKSEKIILVSIALFCFGLFLCNKVRNKQLEKDGKYTLGIIEGITNGKSGQIYSGNYFLQDATYFFSFSDIGRDLQTGDLIFIQVSTKFPKICFNVLDYLDFKVPSCLTIKDIPLNGWNELPLLKCK